MVTFTIVVTKHLKRSSLRGQGSILAHSLRSDGVCHDRKAWILEQEAADNTVSKSRQQSADKRQTSNLTGTSPLPLMSLHLLNGPRPWKIGPLAGESGFKHSSLWKNSHSSKKPTKNPLSVFLFQVGRIEDFLYQLEDNFLKTKKLRTARRQKTKMKRLQTVQQS